MADLPPINLKVNTGPLKDFADSSKDAKQALGDLNTEMAKTKPAADQAAAGVNNVADSATKASAALDKTSASMDTAAAKTSSLAQGLEAIPTGGAKAVQAAEQLAASLVKVGTEGGKAGTITQTLDQIVAKTGVSYTQASAALTAAIAAHRSASDAASANATAFQALGGAAGGAIPPISSLAAAAGSGGAGFTSLASAARIAGTGIGAVSVAVGSAIVYLERMQESADRSRQRLEGLAGIKLGDEYFTGLQKLDVQLGTTQLALAPAIESLVKFRNLTTSSTGFQILPDGTVERLYAAGAGTESATKALQGLFQALRLGGASSADAVAAVNSFAEQVQKTGAFTGDMLRQLQKEAPAAATAIANVFTGGAQNADVFAKTLDKAPASVRSIMTVLQQLEDGNHAAFQHMKDDPKNLSDAIDKLNSSFTQLWKSVTDGNTPIDTGRKAISGLADDLDKIRESLPKAKEEIDLFANAGKSWSDMVAVVDDANSVWGKSIEINVVGGVEKALVEIGKLPTDGIQSLTNFVNASISELESWANTAVRAAQTVGSALASAASAGVGAASSSGANAFGSDISGGSYGAAPSAPVASPTTTAGNGFTFNDMGPDYASQVADGDISAFATGGSFVVGGSGSTDSTLVKFWATPGEKVTVETPTQAQESSSGAPKSRTGISAFADGGSFTVDGAAPKQTLAESLSMPDAGSSAANDALASHIADDFKTQTAALTDTINSARDGIENSIAAAAASIVTGVKSLSAASSTSSTPASTTAASSTTSSLSSTAASSLAASTTTPTLPNEPANSQFSTRQKQNSSSSSNQQSPWRSLQDYLNDPAYNQASRMGTAPAPQSMTPPVRSQRAAASPLQQQVQPTDYQSASGPVDQNGLPAGRLYGPLDVPDIGSAPVSMFGQSRTNAMVPKDSTSNGQSSPDIKQQTDTLKQTSEKGDKSIEDAVKQNADNTKSVGEQQSRSLDGVQKASDETASGIRDASTAAQDTSKSVDQAAQQAQQAAGQDQETLQQTQEATQEGTDATKETTDAAKAGTDATKEVKDQTQQGTEATTQGFQDANQTLDSVNQSVSQASETIQQLPDSLSSLQDAVTEAISSASTDITSAVQSAAADISSAVSNAVSSSANASSSNGSSDTGGSSGYATGGQFTVNGPGHTDTQKVEFWASPGEIVTVTPPGGTPPDNPAFGSMPQSKSGVRAFATGGQMTLGGEFSSPEVAKTSADLIAAHVSDGLRQQQSSLSDKIDLSSQAIIGASNANTAQVAGAIKTLSSAIPDPVAPVPASSTSTATASTSTAASGLNSVKSLQASNFGLGYGLPRTLDAAYAASIGFDPSTYAYTRGGVSGSTAGKGASDGGGSFGGFSGPGGSFGGFAIGGQFQVGRGGLPAFATGGQATVAGFSGDQTNVGTDTVYSGIDTKTDQQTASVKAKVDASTSQITAAMNSNTNQIVSGLGAVKDRFDAWRGSVNVSAKTAPATTTTSTSSTTPAYTIGNSTAGNASQNSLFPQASIAAGSGASDGGGSFGGFSGPGGSFGEYAIGGQFMVGRGLAEGGVITVPGGQSGTDSVDVKVKAAPGEKIMVMPPEEAEKLKQSSKDQQVVAPEPLRDFFGDHAQPISKGDPISSFINDNAAGALPGNSAGIRTAPVAPPMPGSSSAVFGTMGGNDPAPVHAWGNGNAADDAGMTKTVNIFLQSKQQADDFIRSRAEIKRAIG